MMASLTSEARVDEKTVVFAMFVGFGLWEAARGGFFRKAGQAEGDLAADTLAYTLTGLVVVPLVFAGAYGLMALAFPGQKDAWADWPFAAQLLMLVLADDLVQYWWHRTAHNVPALYAMHRAHHETAYMSVRVTTRNNVFYYALMPNFWLAGALIYLGFGWAFAVYLVIKQAVVLGAHSDVRWDAPLYRHRWLHPVAWVIERTISTPSTHHMHHGKHLSDGVTHYKGNYANLFFFWDVLFGTARITRRYPEAYGTEGLAPASWRAQIFSPWGVPVRPGEAEAPREAQTA